MSAVFEIKSRLIPWEGFVDGRWRFGVDVRDFIQRNFKPYVGDGGFLSSASERTVGLWAKVQGLLVEEQARGGLGVSADRASSITAHEPGYLDREAELIVGLQTDAPLKRAIMPNGGLRMVEAGLQAYGFEIDPRISEIWSHYRKSHNAGVLDVYSPEIRKCCPY